MTKPSVGYWVISGLAFVWNLMGVAAYLSQVTSDEALLVQIHGQEAAAMMMAQPAWYTAAFALAVFGGALGCLGLLLRKTWALWPLLLSLLCVVIQHIYYLTHGTYQFVEGGAWVMVLLIPIVAVFLVWFAWRKVADGTLN